MTDDQKLLDEALVRGVITDAQRAELERLKASQLVDGDEKIKVVSNLNEIFVAFGTLLLVNAVGGLASIGSGPIIAGCVHAVFALVVAQYFHRRKRFRLPVIYGVLSAAVSVGYTMYALLADPTIGHGAVVQHATLMQWLAPQISALIVLIGGAAYFRIPFLMLPIGILFAFIVTTAAKFAQDDAPFQLLMGGVGLMILSVALFFDMKDPRRITRWSDFAFWSYAVGSPLFVHSLFLSILLNSGKHFVVGLHVWLLLTVLAMTVTFAGLVLNRRALILSTLIYVGIIIFRMIAGILGGPLAITFHVFSAPGLLFFTLLLIGIYIVLLGSHWPRIRRRVMQRLPDWAWKAKLPPY